MFDKRGHQWLPTYGAQPDLPTAPLSILDAVLTMRRPASGAPSPRPLAKAKTGVLGLLARASARSSGPAAVPPQPPDPAPAPQVKAKPHAKSLAKTEAKGKAVPTAPLSVHNAVLTMRRPASGAPNPRSNAKAKTGVLSLLAEASARSGGPAGVPPQPPVTKPAPQGKAKAKAKSKAKAWAKGKAMAAAKVMVGPPPPRPAQPLNYRDVYQMFKMGAYWITTTRTNNFSALFGDMRLNLNNTHRETWRSTNVTPWNIASETTQVYRMNLHGVDFPDFTINRTSNIGIVWIANEDNIMVRCSWINGRCSARQLPNYDTNWHDPTFNWVQKGRALPVAQPGTPILP